ncbi:MAG: DUF5668 domain-containing protein [Candidatus Margulisiibacteriota bacterium]
MNINEQHQEPKPYFKHKGRRSGSLVIGVTLFILGFLFLLDNFGLIDSAILWPLLLIGIGLALIIKYFFN